MISTPEALLALRAPGADWLATLITALDEAERDPAFSNYLASVFADLAQTASRDGCLPPAVVSAAQKRTREFSARLAEDLDRIESEAQARETRTPHLTLVHG